MLQTLSNKVRKFTALEGEQKIIFIQAWFMLGWARAAILTVSFKRLSAPLQHHRELVTPSMLSPEQLQQASRIGKLVASAASATPWQSRCLAQVLVVQRLLARRDIPGQFYLGVRKGGEDGTDPAGLAAHAWLRCGDVIVNGGSGHEDYTVVSAFSWGKLTRNPTQGQRGQV
ncbi:MAG: lasso peptide biosynthesis B2 protein [Gammaproteobacteria bacterium]|nr:MAG: lasso peptide biosynthesis B2 protein [Gammaproteobacteria bacterium]